MPTDTFTADALAIRDAGGPWPWPNEVVGFPRGMAGGDEAIFLYACVEWLAGRGFVIGRWDEFVVSRYKKEDGRMEYHTAPTFPEAIIAAVKAELGIA